MSQENDRQLPDGWQWVKLGDVCELIMGQSPPSSSYINEPRGLPFFQGKADFGKISPIPRFWCFEPIKIAEVGDILISVRAPVGPTNIVDVQCCIGRGLAAIRPNQDSERDFIHAALRLYENKLVSLGSGSTFEAIGRKDLETLKIPLPPLSEQKRIAAILNEQMEAVEKARKATEAQLEAAKALPAAYLRAVFESEEANSWERRKLGDIARLISGGTPSRNNSSSFKGTIAWVKTLDLNCEVVKETEEYISETAFDEIRGEMLPVGSVMIAMYGGGGTIGKSGILGLPAVTNQAICSILPNYNVFIPEFLHAWVLNFRPKWMDYSSGNRRDPNIKKGVISNIECPFPTVEKQKQIASTLTEQMQEVERLKQNLKEQLDTINKLPAVLLRRAFKGEL
ncbi:restriction endonuclease subunit S [Microcystis sp. BLCC-F210]|uniref:restriction endonuclease subunit S n=1 Tax=Microcystis sp. BLCC-F210 TaxID=3342751 RepID=UPI0035C919FD